MVPDQLIVLNRWILWRNVVNGKRITKVPFAYRGGHASTTKPADWTSWENVQKALDRTSGAWDGPGIVLGDLGNGEVLFGLDLDNCIEDGAIAEWAKPYLQALPTYAEVSPSNCGLKLFGRAKAADLAAARRLLGLSDSEHGRKRTYGTSENGHPPAAELYLSARYFAVTGKTWPGSPEEVAILSPQAFSRLANLFGQRETQTSETTEDLTAPDKDKLFLKIERAKQHNRALRRRWDGDLSDLKDKSRSGYDMSLGSLLKVCGFSYGEMRAALIANHHGAGSENADNSNERYFQRIWSRSSGPEPASKAPPDAPSTALPLEFFDAIQPSLVVQDFVEELLIERSSIVVYGESNCGKTFWVMDLALHVAAGLSWNGREVLQGGVVYIVLEGTAGFRNRVAAWRQERADDRLVLFAAIPQSINLLNPEADVERVISAIQRAAEAFSMAVKLTIVDTLSRALAGGNENSPEDMGALVANMDRIRERTGSAVLFVHHSGKDAAKGARGHSSLRAAIDTEVEVVAAPGTPTRTATVAKQRELETVGEFQFCLKPVELGTNARGKLVTSCVVEAGDSAMSPAGTKRSIPEGRPMLAYRVLCDLIAQYGEAGHGAPDGCLSVPDDWWRERFYDRAMPGADRKTREKAFRRAADALIERQVVALNRGRIWLC